MVNRFVSFWKLFSFKGRYPRSVFWIVLAINVAIFLFAGYVAIRMMDPDASRGPDGVLALLVTPIPWVTLWISIASLCKRFHDLDMPGWYSLILLIPYLGWIGILYFGCRPGTKGPNRYGDDPLAKGETS